MAHNIAQLLQGDYCECAGQPARRMAALLSSPRILEAIDGLRTWQRRLGGEAVLLT